MTIQPGAPNASILLRSTAIFRDLSNDQLAEIWSRARVHNLLRSEILVRQGTSSDSVYVVVSGRFEVWIEGQKNAVNEIGIGEPIGEIGFFAGISATCPRALCGRILWGRSWLGHLLPANAQWHRKRLRRVIRLLEDLVLGLCFWGEGLYVPDTRRSNQFGHHRPADRWPGKPLSGRS